MGQFISQLLSIPELAALTSGAGRLLIRAADNSAWELRTLAIADTTGLQAALDAKAATSHSHAAGDITSGTLGVTRGGTGLASVAAGDLIYASASNTLSALAGNGTVTRKVLTMIAGTPSWVTSEVDSLLNDAVTVPRLAANNTFGGTNTFSAAVQVNDTLTATALAGAGSALTSLNASNISSGSLADARLSANVPLLNASNTFTGGTTTFASSGTATAVIVTGGSSQSTTPLLTVERTGGTDLFTVQNSSWVVSSTTYNIARVRITATLPTAGFGPSDGTGNVFEVWDTTSSKYKFQIRPRRSTSSSTTDIFLDPSYTRIYATDSETNAGRLDFYYSSIYFNNSVGTVNFAGTFLMNRLGDSSAGVVYSSGAITLEPATWNGSSGNIFNRPKLIGKPAAAGTDKVRLAVDMRVVGSSATEEELFHVWQNGFVSIGTGSVKAGAALEVRIGQDTTEVPHSTITQRNRKRSSSQTGNLFEATDENGTVGFAVDANQIAVLKAKTPASASDTGTTGMIAWDSSYIYICTGSNTWKRAAIATW